jgi:hypothetical protein
MPLPVPCVTGLIGGTVEVQWVVLGTPISRCTSYPGISASNRLLVTVGT